MADRSRSELRIGGLVLCGGWGRRMGADKAGLCFGNEHLLQRVVRIVGGVCQPVAVSCRAGQSLPPLPEDVKAVHDRIEDAGPLAGISAGLSMLAPRCDAVLVAACDHPLITEGFLRRLIGSLGTGPGVVPQWKDRRYPLLAVYRREVGAAAEAQLSQGLLRVQDFVERIGAHTVDADELMVGDADQHALLNVNDPGAYETALRTLGLR